MHNSDIRMTTIIRTVKQSGAYSAALSRLSGRKSPNISWWVCLSVVNCICILWIFDYFTILIIEAELDVIFTETTLNCSEPMMLHCFSDFFIVFIVLNFSNRYYPAGAANAVLDRCTSLKSGDKLSGYTIEKVLVHWSWRCLWTSWVY